MFYSSIEWTCDNIRIHFDDTDGEHQSVTLNAHDAHEFDSDFHSWMTINKEKVLDAMRRADQPRRKDS